MESFVSLSIACLWLASLSGIAPSKNIDISSSPSRCPHGPQNGSLRIGSTFPVFLLWDLTISDIYILYKLLVNNRKNTYVLKMVKSENFDFFGDG